MISTNSADWTDFNHIISIMFDLAAYTALGTYVFIDIKVVKVLLKRRLKRLFSLRFKSAPWNQKLQLMISISRASVDKADIAATI